MGDTAIHYVHVVPPCRDKTPCLKADQQNSGHTFISVSAA